MCFLQEIFRSLLNVHISKIFILSRDLIYLSDQVSDLYNGIGQM
jgi:hypothetical protein